MDVVDDYTARVVTSVPFPLLPVRCCPGQSGTIPIFPPQYIKEKGLEYFGANPVGTGPYKFVEWVKDDHVTLEANPDYWGGPPPVKTLVMKPIQEVATRIAAL